MATKKKALEEESERKGTPAEKAIDPFAEPIDVRSKERKATRVITKAKSTSTSSSSAKTAKDKVAKTIFSDPVAAVPAAGSSPAKTSRTRKPKTADVQIEAPPTVEDEVLVVAPALPEVEVSPVFKALAEVKLPSLQRENRARLQMQSPTKLYFYWSVKEDPWSMLKNVFDGSLGNYSFVVKLIDQNSGYEHIHPIDAEGSWWFDVEPSGKYRAEIGFYATGRPYFRVLYSNTVETPRRSPSPRVATESDWKLSATKFAQVLDVAGFSRDAFDVAMAGDDMGLARDASELAFASFIGQPEIDLGNISPDELRYALLALAAGVSLEQLRGKVGPRLFAILQANVDQVDRERATASLEEHFEIEESEFVEEEFGAAVYGASLVNFPKTLKTRTVSTKHEPRYNPVSSHSLR